MTFKNVSSVQFSLRLKCSGQVGDCLSEPTIESGCAVLSANIDLLIWNWIWFGTPWYIQVFSVDIVFIYLSIDNLNLSTLQLEMFQITKRYSLLVFVAWLVFVFSLGILHILPKRLDSCKIIP